MREIIFKRAEMRELSENAWDSREMRETWQVCNLPGMARLHEVRAADQQAGPWFCFVYISVPWKVSFFVTYQGNVRTSDVYKRVGKTRRPSVVNKAVWSRWRRLCCVGCCACALLLSRVNRLYWWNWKQPITE